MDYGDVHFRPGREYLASPARSRAWAGEALEWRGRGRDVAVTAARTHLQRADRRRRTRVKL
jgi:hypothetical protein